MRRSKTYRSKPKVKKGKEEDAHLAICNYLRMVYPDVIFTSDASGLRLGIGLATKFSRLKSGRGIPDLLIFEPRGEYSGLMIEIKREGQKVFKQDGSLYSDVHLKEQAEILDRLKHKGYATYFCIGSKQGIDIIEEYMKQTQIK